MHKPTRKIKLVINCLFSPNINSKKLKKGETYIIVGFGKGRIRDSERREFWVVENFYNAEITSFNMWKSDIDKFDEAGYLEFKGMLK